ncbi:UNVERIFIED_CONTAM: hypothetical protein H355_002653 [Colinus virginianus]|nr:hypothetical protein H355_002653 [Colinus virginianus]
MEDGACPCRPHLMGRQCDQVQPGFFCAPLDHYTYEAEQAMGHGPSHPQLPPDVEPVLRDGNGRMVTWTGPGFARVRDGAGLTFRVDSVPYPMEYELLLRYEPESAEDWEAVVSVSSQALPTSPRCGNLLPSEQMYHEGLPHSQRYVLLSRPFCFEPSTPYEITVRLQRAGVTQRHPSAFILIDSLVLLPRVPELPGFHGAAAEAVQRLEELEHYRCLEAFHMAPPHTLAEACTRLVCSISAVLHDGALQGSVSQLCDAGSGQCRCLPGAVGRQCDRCQPGHWGFPSCRPCQCNGHAEECDPRTGSCLHCRDHTTGRHCERCQDGYYGDPVLGSGQQCRPCPCPGYPGTRHYHGSSCHADEETHHIVCLCAPGYTGPRCDRCSPGYFGTPEMEGGMCRPCQCNNNIDTSDPGACDPRTGHCRRCLYHTAGPRCAQCQPGYFGNALQRSCRLPISTACECEPLGAESPQCDRASGQCQCRPGFGELRCDRCQRGYQAAFPRCSPCHPCFGRWDAALGSLQDGLQLLRARVQALLEGGSAMPLNPRLRALEEALGHAEWLLGEGDSPSSPLLQELAGQLDGTRQVHVVGWEGFRHTEGFESSLPHRTELDNFWKRLQELEQHVDQLEQADVLHRGRLARLSHELGGLNQSTSHLQAVLGTVTAAGFQESYRSIVAAARDSRHAEMVANGTAGELGTARATQRAAERALRQRGDAFRRSMAAQRKSLREAQKRLSGLSVAGINEKICGAPGDQSCAESPCGGALCRDSAGTRHCGGVGCTGALPVSAQALSSARNASQQLEVALGQLSTITQKMQEVQDLARGARSRAEEALERSQAARRSTEKATAQLRDFIRRIKAFLAEEGADPGSIELVARQVLNISLPSSPAHIQELLREMQESISQLDGVDAVLNSTAQGLAAARGLLAQGQDARQVVTHWIGRVAGP